VTPNQLRTVLDKLGLTNTDVATIAGVTPRQVNSWLRGVNSIPRSIVLILAALDNKQLSIDWLVQAVEMEVIQEARQGE
jgi:transcriptional regulator with XRE-family HTH domain